MTWGCAVQGNGWACMGFDTRFGVPGWKDGESVDSKIERIGDVFIGWAGFGFGDNTSHTIASL